MGLKIINNVEANHSKTTQNTRNTLETFTQMEIATSKNETSAMSESEYVTDSEFEPATEDEIEITILDSDFEQSKISKENPSSLMEKVKEILSFARFILFTIVFAQTNFQINVVINIFFSLWHFLIFSSIVLTSHERKLKLFSSKGKCFCGEAICCNGNRKAFH